MHVHRHYKVQSANESPYLNVIILTFQYSVLVYRRGPEEHILRC